MTRIATAYALAMSGFLLAADLGWLGSVADYINTRPPIDKALHFLMYGLLALLVNAAMIGQRRWPPLRAFTVGTIVVLIAATIEEASNMVVMHRSWSLGDLAANYLGIICLGSLPLWRIAARADGCQIETTPR